MDFKSWVDEFFANSSVDLEILRKPITLWSIKAKKLKTSTIQKTDE